MLRKTTLMTMVLTLVVWAASLSVFAKAPNFGPAIYADGEAWGTKGLKDFPPPNGHNDQSFDKLFSFSNGAEGQLPVAEAAPGNPDYNGGRWNAQEAMWTQSGLTNLDPLPVVKSYDDIMMYKMLQYLVTAPANPPHYFECPLLPVK